MTNDNNTMNNDDDNKDPNWRAISYLLTLRSWIHNGGAVVSTCDESYDDAGLVIDEIDRMIEQEEFFKAVSEAVSEEKL